MNTGLVFAEFDILCLIIMGMITLLTVMQSQKAVNQRSYLFLMICAIVLVASDLGYEIFLTGKVNFGLPVLYIFNILYFLASIAISYAWFVYAQRIMGNEKVLRVKFRICFFIPAGLLMAAIIASSVTGWIFALDEYGNYSRGPYNWLCIATTSAYLLGAVCVAVIYYLRCRDEKTRRSMYSVITFVIFPLVFVALQMFFVGAPLVCIGAMLGMLWVFVYTMSNEREKLAADRIAAEAKSQFFATMSHEIRTPISAVLGMNTMIIRESSEPNIVNYAKIVENSGKMLLSVVNDILDFSKSESGKLSLVHSEYKPRDIVYDIVQMFKSRAEEKNLKFNIEIDEDFPSGLYGDEIRIRQILVNLLANAIKYTDKGSVTLKVAHETIEDKVVMMRATVSDTGRGIRQEDLERLYSPFERFDEGKSPKTEGTGLGMSIVKRILDLMNSKLEVESTYGEGSTFSFKIIQPVCDMTPIGPIENIMKEATVNTPQRKLFTAASARVLSVDDNAVNLTVFKALLKKTQIQIDTATSGPEALQKVMMNSYDAIFVDHLMPAMDGVEVLKRMRSEDNHVTKETPIIVLTANVVVGYRDKFIEAGFDDFLAKPIDANELERVVIKYLPKEKITYINN